MAAGDADDVPAPSGSGPGGGTPAAGAGAGADLASAAAPPAPVPPPEPESRPGRVALPAYFSEWRHEMINFRHQCARCGCRQPLPPLFLYPCTVAALLERTGAKTVSEAIDAHPRAAANVFRGGRIACTPRLDAYASYLGYIVEGGEPRAWTEGEACGRALLASVHEVGARLRLPAPAPPPAPLPPLPPPDPPAAAAGAAAGGEPQTAAAAASSSSSAAGGAAPKEPRSPATRRRGGGARAGGGSRSGGPSRSGGGASSSRAAATGKRAARDGEPSDRESSKEEEEERDELAEEDEAAAAAAGGAKAKGRPGASARRPRPAARTRRRKRLRNTADDRRPWRSDKLIKVLVAAYAVPSEEGDEDAEGSSGGGGGGGAAAAGGGEGSAAGSGAEEDDEDEWEAAQRERWAKSFERLVEELEGDGDGGGSKGKQPAEDDGIDRDGFEAIVMGLEGGISPELVGLRLDASAEARAELLRSATEAGVGRLRALLLIACAVLGIYERFAARFSRSRRSWGFFRQLNVDPRYDDALRCCGFRTDEPTFKARTYLELRHLASTVRRFPGLARVAGAAHAQDFVNFVPLLLRADERGLEEVWQRLEDELPEGMTLPDDLLAEAADRGDGGPGSDGGEGGAGSDGEGA
eukprot:tig00020801_g13949.t1